MSRHSVITAALLALLLSSPFAVAPAALAQETSAQADTPEVTTAGVGQLSARGRRVRLPFIDTVQGPLVSLQAVVAAIGGELEVGPLGQSHTLRLFDEEFILGPESAAMTVGEEIIPLSRQPLLGVGGLEVPLDVLRKSYGDRLGFRFRWDDQERLLTVEMGGPRALAASVSSIHLGATTSVVVRLATDARFRLERRDGGADLVFPGRLLEVEGSLPRPDELLRGIEVAPSRLRLRLDEGAEAAEPYRVVRGDRIDVVVDVARARQRTVARVPRDLRRDDSGLKIVIDPGHGGYETGTIGKSGSFEKDLTLQLAKALRTRLRSMLPARVVLTRERDEYLDLESRTAIANQNRADLFISIHLNSLPGGNGGRGAETYILDAEASDQAAAEAARLENQSGGSTSSELADEELDVQLILWDLAQTRHLRQSLRLGSLIQEELNRELDLRNRGVKQAPFLVLTGATMPAVLVELGFLSNPEEEAQLLDPAHRGRLAAALAAAVTRYWNALQQRRTGSAGAADGEQP